MSKFLEKLSRWSSTEAWQRRPVEAQLRRPTKRTPRTLRSHRSSRSFCRRLSSATLSTKTQPQAAFRCGTEKSHCNGNNMDIADPSVHVSPQKSPDGSFHPGGSLDRRQLTDESRPCSESRTRNSYAESSCRRDTREEFRGILQMWKGVSMCHCLPYGLWNMAWMDGNIVQ